jgi:hypothetical protein
VESRVNAAGDLVRRESSGQHRANAAEQDLELPISPAERQARQACGF